MGYDTLGRAISPLLGDRRTVDQVFGFLLSVAVNNFALSSIFAWLRSSENADILEYKPLLTMMQHPGALKLMLELLSVVPPSDDGHLPRTIYMITEYLAGICHRNKVLLGSMSAFGALYKRFLELEEGDSTRPFALKLLKRLAETGLPLADVRLLFDSSLKNQKTLNGDALEIIRAGMKSRWPQHYSFERDGCFTVKVHNSKGLPLGGLTFVV